jgi:hypothetical protein
MKDASVSLPDVLVVQEMRTLCASHGVGAQQSRMPCESQFVRVVHVGARRGFIANSSF